MFRPNAVTKNWETKCKRQNFKFAQIQTVKAIYDRAAIVEESEKQFVVEFIKKNKDKYVIQKDNIAKSTIIRIRYFQD